MLPRQRPARTPLRQEVDQALLWVGVGRREDLVQQLLVEGAIPLVQRLNFHGQPVVQIVYLPEQGGGPVALCVTRDREPDASPQARQVGEMQTVAWRRGNLGYVLLGRGSQIDLSRLGHRIASAEAAALYSRRVVPEARTLSRDG